MRPGLERLRDLAAEGQIQVVLVYSPDRLSRNYAYQTLLIDELAREGVEARFVKAPQSETPEGKLLVQFQGMISEYERAQIQERTRRGKIHRAKQGCVSVLSAAPYGYKYIKKNDERGASYEIFESEAQVVRLIFDLYANHRLSILGVCRRLKELGYSNRKSKSWDLSTIWQMLRNPAYKGTACFGKTCQRERQKAILPSSKRRAITSSHTSGHDVARENWIEIPVHALMSEETFLFTQELLFQNRKFSKRKTITHSLLQGLVCCRKCSSTWYRAGTYSPTHVTYSYYRSAGSDNWRSTSQVRCDQKPIRMD